MTRRENLYTLERLAHSLKGVSANLGIKSVEAQVIKHEKACKAKSDDIDSYLTDVLASLEPEMKVCNSSLPIE